MIIYEEVFRAFQKEKVRYVVVGGIAVNLLGSLRTTADLDLLVEMTDKNLAKIVKILKRQGYRIKQPVDPMGIADPATRKDWIENKHMKAFNFYKDETLKEVDLIIESPVPYKGAKKKAKRVKVDDLTIPVISVDDLIKMKKASGRPVDQLDIAELARVRQLRRRR